ncbi:Hypothetical protein, putative, partial [Bodo saltans]
MDPVLKERIQNILLKYDPTKVKTADALYNSFDGRESAVLGALSRKYGPEPTDVKEIAELRKEHGLPPQAPAAPPKDTTPAATTRASPASKPPTPTKTAAKTPAGAPAPPERPPAPGPVKKAPVPPAAVKSPGKGVSPARAATPPRVPPKQAPSDDAAPSSPQTPARKGTPSAKNAPPPPPGGGAAKAAPPPAPGAPKIPPPGKAAASPATSPAKKSSPSPASRKSSPAPPAPTPSKASKGVKQAPAPPAAKGPPPGISEASWREQIEIEAQIEVLRGMYAKHAPEKVNDVEGVLENHAHELDDLFQAMENKYKLPPGTLQSEIDAIVAVRTGAAPAATPSSPSKKGGGGSKVATPVTESSPQFDEDQPAASGVGSPGSPGLRRTLSAKDVQDTSKQLVQEVVEEFFESNGLNDRAAQAAGLVQQYDGKHQDLFKALQQEFGKPVGYFKNLLNAKSKAAADDLVKQGAYSGKKKGSAATAARGASAAATAAQTSKDAFWKRVDVDSATASSPFLYRSPTGRVFTFREQLEYFCDKYCPSKAASIENALRVYRGRELELMSTLHDTYGVDSGAEYLPLTGDSSIEPPPPPTAPERVADSPARGGGAAGGKKGKAKGQAVDLPPPTPKHFVPLTAINPNGGSIGSTPAVDRIPEEMRSAAELARHFGLGPQFVPRVMEQYGREDTRRVMFEVLATIFPDAVSHALASDEQRIAFAARRVAHFLTFHQPSAKGAVGRIVAQYAENGRLDEAMGDLIIRYYGQLLSEVPLKAFETGDLVSGLPDGATAGAGSPGGDAASPNRTLSRIFNAVDLNQTAGSPSLGRMESSANFGSPGGGPSDDAAAQLVLRRREFRRTVDDWMRQYSGASNVSRSTPRALGRMGDMFSVGTSSADLPRDVVEASVSTFHREHEEARLLGLVERGMVTDPFSFEIRSYQDAVEKKRRSFGGGVNVGTDSLQDMRQERHNELYGRNALDLSSAVRQQQDRTLLSNPMIFLEDDDCPKCKVLQHQLESAKQRLHGIRAQQQHRDRLQKFEEMEQRAAEDALITDARAARGLPRYGVGNNLLMLDGDGGDSCTSCDQLRQQVKNLSARLHTLRTQPPPPSADDRGNGGSILMRSNVARH